MEPLLDRPSGVEGSDPLLVLAPSSSLPSLDRMARGDMLLGTVNGIVFILQGRITRDVDWGILVWRTIESLLAGTVIKVTTVVPSFTFHSNVRLS